MTFPLALRRKLQGLLLFASCCALLLGAVAGAQGTGRVELEDEVFNIASKLRCPVCQGESVADSNAEISIEMRNIIRDKLQAGQSEAQVLDYFKRSHGDWILLDPPHRGLYLWVWYLPLAAALFGLALLIFYLRRWQHKGKETTALSAEERERVARELGNV